MKKLFTLLAMTALWCASYAGPVDEPTARIAATKFLKEKGAATDLKLAYKASSANGTNTTNAINYFYVFNSATNGFVIVSADDDVVPVLGYSTTGSFDAAHIPVNAAKWLEGYKSQIRYVIETKLPATNEIRSQWKALLSNTPYVAAKSTAVSPLMQTTWNQSPFYNALCPWDNTYSENTVTGCTATAMAQVMKFWNHPAQGSGFHSYNHNTYGTLSANFGGTTYQWGQMPNNVTSANTAVATLMYHIGVSVDMDYGVAVNGGSGAYVIESQSPWPNCAEYALKTYFDYTPSLHGEERSNYSDLQWINMLKADLDAGRPIIYAGYGTGGGHCFVADGYDNSNFFHFNWGWGGMDDGYFQIDALNPGNLGIGGGSGGFNSNQQAVLGVEPNNTSGNTVDMQLYDYVTPSSGTIYYGNSFTVYSTIANLGTGTFSGDYCAAAFDQNNNFVDYVEILSGQTLPAGYQSGPLAFYNPGLLSMLPGNYNIQILYRPNGGNWTAVSDAVPYQNLAPMTVINPNDMELNAPITVAGGTTITENDPVSVSADIINNGWNFSGTYDLSIYTLAGTHVATVQQMTGMNLASGANYPGGLTFSTASLVAPPGTYLMVLQHLPNGGSWQLTGSTNFQNPIMVTIQAPGLTPDIYEVNNTNAQSYTLPQNYVADVAVTGTPGSTAHLGTDMDYYKLVLSPGYNYTIEPRLHDSYSSGNGNTYTLDEMFSYSTNGTTWSQTYDDIMPMPIVASGGTTVYFHCAPYFQGSTGTYLLDIEISRSPVSVASAEDNNGIDVYPNPAKDVVNINFGKQNHNVNNVRMTDIQGRCVLNTDINNSHSSVALPVGNFAAGIYFVQMQTATGVVSQKITVSK